MFTHAGATSILNFIRWLLGDLGMSPDTKTGSGVVFPAGEGNGTGSFEIAKQVTHL